jgi:hypothetical protein
MNFVIFNFNSLSEYIYIATNTFVLYFNKIEYLINVIWSIELKQSNNRIINKQNFNFLTIQILKNKTIHALVHHISPTN